MNILKNILYGLPLQNVEGITDRTVKALRFDSRKVEEGDCYIAQRGTQVDGHDFIEQAIEKGAKTIVCEKIPKLDVNDVTFVQVEDSSQALGEMAHNFYGQPSDRIKLIGVTGTNGKTTTVSLLYDLFTSLGKRSGLISTVLNRVGDNTVPATHTTPDAVQINQLLAQMVDSDCEYCFMEVSSHAVVQHRVAGLNFAGGVFTNITPEHLDFHKTFKDYIAAKQLFFTALSSKAWALSNRDDKNGEVMLQNSRAKKHYYALKKPADFKCKIMESSFDGLLLKLDEQEVWSPLVGRFNAYNLTAIYGVAMLLGQDKLEVLTAISQLKPVAGRFQFISVAKVSGIVDYAHSPDALENVLKTIKEIRGGNEQVITVVGCGGDRDRSKRPLMAEIACNFSDRVILTSDNPRSEDPDAIIAEMMKGVDKVAQKKVISISNRREAIRTASSLAEAGDIVLVAGKGHETYQEIKGERKHFDDREELSESLHIFHSPENLN
jgi:UDP-N-acetylmuramoyl-L-alanyl-D-glutamate--2,6-diaminopimelate ligase